MVVALVGRRGGLSAPLPPCCCRCSAANVCRKCVQLLMQSDIITMMNIRIPAYIAYVQSLYLPLANFIIISFTFFIAVFFFYLLIMYISGFRKFASVLLYGRLPLERAPLGLSNDAIFVHQCLQYLPFSSFLLVLPIIYFVL